MVTNEATTVKAEAEEPWHAAYPAPKTTAPGIKRENILSWMKEGRFPADDIVLVDLRRTDYEASCRIVLPVSLFEQSASCRSIDQFQNLKVLILVGWYNPRINQSSGSVPLSYNPGFVLPVQECRSKDCDLVLRYVLARSPDLVCHLHSHRPMVFPFHY